MKDKRRKIIILGSTGSIGKNTLDVIRQNTKSFEVVGLTAGSNIDLLREQAKEFKPKAVAIFDEAKKINIGLPKTKVLRGLSGINELVKAYDADLVVVAISGSAVLFPLVSAIRAKKNIAFANKETIVMAGRIIMEEAKTNNINLIPIDSEQSAIFQCLRGNKEEDLNKIYLTASGGPFYNLKKSRLANITVKQALNHPRWKMGKKISVDSATLMNKGLEVIEAMYLFNISPKNIKILIHPEVIIHSMVEFVDKVVIAQLSEADMKFPISYALSFPNRLGNNFKRLDFAKIKNLTFENPDFNKFPCLKIAYDVALKDNSFCAVLNAANEELVKAFLANKIKFMDIPCFLEKVLSRHKETNNPKIIEILAIDNWARDEVSRYIAK